MYINIFCWQINEKKLQKLVLEHSKKFELWRINANKLKEISCKKAASCCKEVKFVLGKKEQFDLFAWTRFSINKAPKNYNLLNKIGTLSRIVKNKFFSVVQTLRRFETGSVMRRFDWSREKLKNFDPANVKFHFDTARIKNSVPQRPRVNFLLGAILTQLSGYFLNWHWLEMTRDRNGKFQIFDFISRFDSRKKWI